MEISFNLYNENSVDRLQDENPDILPEYAADESADLSYNKEQINSAIESAIIQGKSIDGIADDLQDRLKSINESSAVKTARTAMTNAQAAGTLESFYEAQELGIEIQKEWLCTQDDRTRPSHLEIDGERRDLDEEFSNGLQYPGDSSGEPGEVYNCRCTMVAYFPDIEGDLEEAAEDEKEGEFEDWQKDKEKSEETQVTSRQVNKINNPEYNWMDLVPKDITEEQWNDTETYIGTPDAFYINHALRTYPELSIREAMEKYMGGGFFTQEQIDNVEKLQELIQNHELEYDVTLIRNVDELKALAGLDIEELIYSFNDADTQKVLSKLIGETIIEDGLMSTSGREEENFFTRRDIEMVIDAPKGTKALITRNAEESEIILPRGTQFELIGFDREVNKKSGHAQLVIYLKVTGQ